MAVGEGGVAKTERQGEGIQVSFNLTFYVTGKLMPLNLKY